MKKWIFPSYIFIFGLIALLLDFSQVQTAFAQDADKLIKQAEGELRRSNSKLMSGRYKDVYKMLQETDKTILAAQSADPDHNKLQKVINNFLKQKERVEEKLGQELTISFDPNVKEPAAPAPPQNKPVIKAPAVAAPPAPPAIGKQKNTKKPGKLPYDARYPMQQFKNAHNSFTGNYSKFSGSADADMKNSLMKRMADNLDYMKENLQKARDQAAKKGVESHPDFDDAAQKITQAEQNYQSLKQDYKKQVAAAKVNEEKIGSDSEGIKKLYNKLRDQIFDKATGTAIYFNKPAEAEQLLKDIKKFEESDQAQVEKTLREFSEKYGDSEEAIKKSTGDWQTANSYMEIKNGIDNIAKTREAMAIDLLKKYERGFSSMASTSDFYKIEYAADLQQYVDMAVQFSPDNAQAKKAKSEHQKRVDAELKSFYAKIDKRTWPGHSSNAPSNSNELAKAALEWFKNDPGWGKRDQNPEAADKQARKPLAVAVKGPWSVQKKNLLGNPIMYGLPVLIAVEVPNEKSLNVVRVYDVTMRTAEKSGVKQEPPFFTITVGSSYYIRPSAL